MSPGGIALATAAVLSAGAPAFAQTSTSTAVLSRTSTGTITRTATTSDDPTPLIEGLNTSERPDPDPGLGLGRLLLELPRHLVELGLTPVSATAYLFERYSVVDRLLDFFANDARTFAVLPIVEPFSASGVGFGALAAWNDPLGSPDRLVALVLARVNGDLNLTFDFGRRLPFVRGRALSARVAGSINKDANFFGLGDQQRSATQTLIRRDNVDVELGLSLLSPSVPVLTADGRVAYRRRRIASGEGDQAPIFVPGEPVNGEVLRPPPGFGQTLDYPEAAVQFGVDTRNSFGLTSRGIILRLDGLVTHDVNGSNTGGYRVQTDFAWFIPLLLRNRTLYLRTGVGAALPFQESDDVPLHVLPSLGAPNTLRGFPPDRFVDELAWWATVEYRWFFYEWSGTGGGLVATLFADFGNVGDRFTSLFRGRLPWSVGFTLRAEQSLIMLGRLQFGFSNEGFQVSFNIGDLL